MTKYTGIKSQNLTSEQYIWSWPQLKVNLVYAIMYFRPTNFACVLNIYICLLFDKFGNQYD